MNCENCGEPHSGEYASGRFCSSKCAKTRTDNTPKRYNWTLIQKEYDTGKTYVMLAKEFGVSIGALSYAASRGYLAAVGRSGKRNQAGLRRYWENLSSEKRVIVSRNMRLARLKKLNEGYPLIPNFNPKACAVIDEYGQIHGYNFQHAMNGGEFYIKGLGYWVDGYDKERNAVIEYYERRHEGTADRDLKRQREITEFLGCEFIILKETRNTLSPC